MFVKFYFGWSIFVKKLFSYSTKVWMNAKILLRYMYSATFSKKKYETKQKKCFIKEPELNAAFIQPDHNSNWCIRPKISLKPISLVLWQYKLLRKTSNIWFLPGSYGVTSEKSSWLGTCCRKIFHQLFIVVQYCMSQDNYKKRKISRNHCVFSDILYISF